MSQSQALWSISRGEALSMEIGPGARELSVTEGRLWLTQAGSLEDVWLEPGQSVALASGSRVVMEAWPEARFQLLVPPAVCADYQRRRAPASAAASWGKKESSASSGLAPA